jgi:hypothetical protein
MRFAPAFKLLVPLAVIGAFVAAAGRKPVGSPTNASDAVDDIELDPDASRDEKLDEGVQETFPASDPVSVNGAAETAYEKEQRRRRRESS